MRQYVYSLWMEHVWQFFLLICGSIFWLWLKVGQGRGTWDVGTQGFWDVGRGDVGTWDLGMLGRGTRGRGMRDLETWGRGTRGCGDMGCRNLGTSGCKDVINKQHLNFALNFGGGEKGAMESLPIADDFQHPWSPWYTCLLAYFTVRALGTE